MDATQHDAVSLHKLFTDALVQAIKRRLEVPAFASELRVITREQAESELFGSQYVDPVRCNTQDRSEKLTMESHPAPTRVRSNAAGLSFSGVYPPELGAHITLELAGEGGEGSRLVLWLEPPFASRAVEAGAVWLEMRTGEGVEWWQFEHVTSAFNRAAFELRSMRPASDPALRPEGVWLPPRARRSPAPGAST